MTSTLMDRLGRFLILCTFGCLTLGVFEGSAIAAQASLEQVPDGVACARCRVDRRTAGASLSLDRSPVAVSGPCFRTRCYLLGRRPASPLRFVRGCGHETDSVLRTGPRAVAPSIPGSRLAPDGATPRRSIVTAKPDQFRLHIWDEEGSLRSGLARRSPWFPDSGGGSTGTPSQPPTPAITAIDVDRDGLIWAFVRVAAPTWRQAWARVPPGAREARLSEVDFQSLYRTRVEVIDPVSRRVLATADIPGLTLAALGGGRVAMYAADASGDPVLRIEEVRLIRPSRP